MDKTVRNLALLAFLVSAASPAAMATGTGTGSTLVGGSSPGISSFPPPVTGALGTTPQIGNSGTPVDTTIRPTYGTGLLGSGLGGFYGVGNSAGGGVVDSTQGIGGGMGNQGGEGLGNQGGEGLGNPGN